MNSKLIYWVPGSVLPALFKKLENEERPHELIISTAKQAGKRMIAIHTTADNAEYFRNLLEKSL